VILAGCPGKPGRGGWGALEDHGTGPLRQQGGYPVDNTGWHVGGKQSASEAGGIVVVYASFDVQGDGADL